MSNPSRKELCKQLHAEHYHYIRRLAEEQLLDKTLVEVVLDLTFMPAFHSIHNLQPDPRTWLTNTLMEIIGRYNKSQNKQRGKR